MEKKTGVDTKGNPSSGPPVIDPTENVKDLFEAANKRQDDLRNANEKLTSALVRAFEKNTIVRFAHAKEISILRADHYKEMRSAEADRLNSIRQVDVAAAKTEADRQLAATQLLSQQTQTNAENLRNLLNTTAQTIATSNANTVAQIIERIAALEKSSYEGKGKGSVVDPQMAEMLMEIKTLRQTTVKTEGKAEGGWNIVQIISTVIGIGGVVFGIIMAFK